MNNAPFFLSPHGVKAAVSALPLLLALAGCSGVETTATTGDPPAPVPCDDRCATLWSQAYGGDAQNEGKAIASDTNGNIIVAGTAYGGVDFGTGAIENGVYFAAFDPTGVPRYAHAFSGNHSNVFTGFAASAAGDVVLGIQTDSDSIDLGTGPLAANAGSQGTDLVVGRFSPNGTPVWSKRFHASAEQGDVIGASGFALAPDLGVFIAGGFVGTLDLGGGSDGAPTSAAPSFAPYVSKLGAAGEHLWSRTFAITDPEDFVIINAIATDAGGSVYAAGFFTGSLEVIAPAWQAEDESDAFIIKLSPTGEVVWARHFGGGQDGFRSITVLPGGTLAVTGAYTNTLDLGDGPLPAVLTSTPFLATFAGDGAVLWSRSMSDHPGGIAGLAAAAGPTRQSLALLGGVIDSSEPRAFQVSLLDAAAGGTIATRTFTSDGQLFPAAIATDPAGHVLLTGKQRGQADFGTGSAVKANAWIDNTFVAKITP